MALARWIIPLALACSPALAKTSVFRSLDNEPGASFRDFGDWALYRRDDVMTGRADRLWLFAEPGKAVLAGARLRFSCHGGGGISFDLKSPAKPLNNPASVLLKWDDEQAAPVAMKVFDTYLMPVNPSEEVSMVAAMRANDRLAVRYETAAGVETELYDLSGFRDAWLVFAGECATMAR